MSDTPNPAADDEPVTYGTITVLEATNAETTALRPGEIDETTILQEPELHDGTPVYAQRDFEPVATVDLPDRMTNAEIRDWLSENQDLEAFDVVDWDAEDDKDWISTIVENRQSYRRYLADLEQRIADINAVGLETQNQLEEIQAELIDVSNSSEPPVTVNCRDGSAGTEAVADD